MEEEIIVTGHRARGGGRDRDRRLRGRAVGASGSSATRSPRSLSTDRDPGAPDRSGKAKARPTINAVLTERQELVLRRLVEEYLDAGAPVGSKALSGGLEWGPSTIRHELANLEELGLLAHPHTSAGRVPTEAGYRYFVDRLLPDRDAGAAAVAVARAPRARRGDAGHDRDALAGHQPAGDRHRAADRDLDDPPRRGPAAPAAGADGRRDHLHRRRHQAPVHVRAARSIRAWPTGRPAI